MKKFIAIFTGESCSGKSTIIQLLLPKYKNTYYLSGDRFKKYFSKYTQKDHSDIKHKVNKEIYKMLCKNNISIFFEPSKTEAGDLGFFIRFAKKQKYRVLVFHITVLPKILIERFRERIIKAKQNKRVLTVKRMSEYKERNICKSDKVFKNAIIIDNSGDIKNTIKNIKKHLKEAE